MNPYAEIIATRNVFALKEPPPPPSAVDTAPPPPKIILVGIANVLGVKKAVLKPQTAPGTAPKASVPGQIPHVPLGQESPLVLTEGATQDGITVVSIDEATGTVNIDNNGQYLVLTFDKDGLKVPTGTALPALVAAGAVGQPGVLGIPRPLGMPGVVNSAGGNSLQSVNIPNGLGAGSGRPTGGGIPGAEIGTAGGGSSPANVPQREVRGQQRPLTPEEAFILTEVNREKSDALIKAGILPKMPPPIGGVRPNIPP